MREKLRQKVETLKGVVVGGARGVEKSKEKVITKKLRTKCSCYVTNGP